VTTITIENRSSPKYQRFWAKLQANVDLQQWPVNHIATTNMASPRWKRS